MFEKFKSALNSTVETAKSAFSFGKKSEVSKPVELAPEVDVRPEINQRVSNAMQDKAIDDWAVGGGWNAGVTKAEPVQARTPGKLDHLMFEMSDKTNAGPDLSVFNKQSVLRDETTVGENFVKVAAERPVLQPKVSSGKLDNMVLDLPRTLAQTFKVDVKAGNGGWFGVKAWPTVEQGRMLEPVDSSMSIFAEFGEAGKLDETPTTAMFMEAAREALRSEFAYAPRPVEMPVRAVAPVYAPVQQPVRAPQPRPSFADIQPFGYESFLDKVFGPRMKTAFAVAALMATVGGVAHASANHSPKPRSYSIEDIVPLTNAQAAQMEAESN